MRVFLCFLAALSLGTALAADSPISTHFKYRGWASGIYPPGGYGPVGAPWPMPAVGGFAFGERPLAKDLDALGLVYDRSERRVKVFGTLERDIAFLWSMQHDRILIEAGIYGNQAVVLGSAERWKAERIDLDGDARLDLRLTSEALPARTRVFVSLRESAYLDSHGDWVNPPLAVDKLLAKEPASAVYRGDLYHVDSSRGWLRIHALGSTQVREVPLASLGLSALQRIARLLVADLDGDGHPDLLLAGQGAGSRFELHRVLGDPSRETGFAPAEALRAWEAGAKPPIASSLQVVEDFSGDGQPRLVLVDRSLEANRRSGTWTARVHSLADGALPAAGIPAQPLESAPVTIRYPTGIVDGSLFKRLSVHDLDGDGKSDLLFWMNDHDGRGARFLPFFGSSEKSVSFPSPPSPNPVPAPSPFPIEGAISGFFGLFEGSGGTIQFSASNTTLGLRSSAWSIERGQQDQAFALSARCVYRDPFSSATQELGFRLASDFRIQGSDVIARCSRIPGGPSDDRVIGRISESELVIHRNLDPDCQEQGVAFELRRGGEGSLQARAWKKLGPARDATCVSRARRIGE